ncbi:MAG: TolC family protein [Gemmatimonadaceae bacterium]|nr:TolC family protein [Gemmatimonadaceae bacterium]MCW5826607.1 TolC family protein [Gemmatimonadaceae bacterium]
MTRAIRPVAAVLLLWAVPLWAQAPLRFSLADAVARAQRESHAAKAAAATRDAARARDRAFGAGLLPQLALTGNAPSYNRSIIPVIDPVTGQTVYREQEQNEASANMALTQRLPVLGGDLFVSSALSRLDRGGSINDRLWNSTPLLLGIRQDIFRPNRLRWDSREQDLRADIAERAYLEAMEDIAVQATNTFFDYYTAQLQLVNAETNAAVNDTLYTLNRGRFEVGRLGENELLQSELALLRAQVALDGARLERDRTLAALRLALNLPVGTALEVVVDADVPELRADTTLAVQQALRNRATIADLHLQETQADRRVAEARYGTGAGATLQASMGFNQTSLGGVGDVYRDLGEAQRVTLAVSVPLVQWGGRTAQMQAAKLDGERVEHAGRQTREQTAQEAHFAALQLALTRRQLAIAAKADTVGAKRFDVAKNRYVIGRIGPDILYQAQTEKDQALLQYLQSLRGYWVAYYRLRRVTMYDFVAERPIR